MEQHGSPFFNEYGGFCHREQIILYAQTNGIALAIPHTKAHNKQRLLKTPKQKGDFSMQEQGQMGKQRIANFEYSHSNAKEPMFRQVKAMMISILLVMGSQSVLADINFLVIQLNSAAGAVTALPLVSLANSCPAGYVLHRFGIDDAVGFQSETNITTGDVDGLFGAAGSRLNRGLCVAGVPASVRIVAPQHAAACTNSPLATTTLAIGNAPVSPSPCIDSSGAGAYMLMLPDNYLLAGYFNAASGGTKYNAVLAGILGRTYVAAGPAYTLADMASKTIYAGPLSHSYLCSLSNSAEGFGLCSKGSAAYGVLLPKTVAPRQAQPGDGTVNFAVGNYTYTLSY